MAIFGKLNRAAGNTQAANKTDADRLAGQQVKIVSEALNANLDFEIGYIFSPELYQDPKVAQVLSEVGITQESRGNKMPLLKDAVTVRNVQASPADDKLRLLLKKSGIGLVQYDRGIQNGYDQQKTVFHFAELRKIIAMNYDSVSKKRAVFDLHRFTNMTMRGESTG